jgi:hypothetical protein
MHHGNGYNQGRLMATVKVFNHFSTANVDNNVALEPVRLYIQNVMQ